MNISIESIYNWYRSIIRNPKYRWWIIGGTFVYLLSPFDIAPDFFPVIGWIDDGVLATLLVAELSQILLERLKAGKDGSAEQGVSSSNDAATNNYATTTNATTTGRADTVDVNAVSLD